MCNGKYICCDCNFSAKGHGGVCPHCGSKNVIDMWHGFRVPRKRASKQQWKKFWNFIITKSSYVRKQFAELQQSK